MLLFINNYNKDICGFINKKKKRNVYYLLKFSLSIGKFLIFYFFVFYTYFIFIDFN